MGSSFSCSSDGKVVEQGQFDIDVLSTASRTLSMTQTPRGGSAEALSLISDSPRHCVGSDLPSPQPDALDVPVAATNPSSLSTTSSNHSSGASTPVQSPPFQPIHRTVSLMSADSLLSPISPSSMMEPKHPPRQQQEHQEGILVSPNEAQNHEYGSCVLSSGEEEILSIASDSPAEQQCPTDIAPLERQDSNLTPSMESPHPMAEGSGFMSLNNLIREESKRSNMITSPGSMLGKVVLLRAPPRAQSIAGLGSRVPTPVID